MRVIAAATTTGVQHLSANQTAIVLGFVAGLILLTGIIVAVSRSKMPRKASAAQPDDSSMSLVRSWLAIALVGGLLIFCAASFALDDTTLRSSLMGGLIASAGAATAFYFASKAADQARKDILAASGSSVDVPQLTGLSRDQVDQAMAGVPLALVPQPRAAKDGWIAKSQDPAPHQTAPTGSAVTVMFDKDSARGARGASAAHSPEDATVEVPPSR